MVSATIAGTYGEFFGQSTWPSRELAGKTPSQIGTSAARPKSSFRGVSGRRRGCAFRVMVYERENCYLLTRCLNAAGKAKGFPSPDSGSSDLQFAGKAKVFGSLLLPAFACRLSARCNVVRTSTLLLATLYWEQVWPVAPSALCACASSVGKKRRTGATPCTTDRVPEPP
jgi:hypothetical protein